MTHATKTIGSPVGPLKLVCSHAGLTAILWQSDLGQRVRLGPLHPDSSQPVLLQAEQELGNYFAGHRTLFTLPLDMAGTPFQTRVWQALLTIPFGQTRSYGQIARQLGHPAASRAVGAANGRNPLPIVVPCHRVVGADGTLTGFAGGLDIKRYLLSLERPSQRDIRQPALDLGGRLPHLTAPD